VEYWKNSLVVHVLGRRVNFKMLVTKLHRDQKKVKKNWIISLPRNFYVVQFTSPMDYNHALFEGPWMIVDHYHLVQWWHPFFQVDASIEWKVAMWVRIPILSLELFNETFLRRVGLKLEGFS